jgi:hypothetical protein
MEITEYTVMYGVYKVFLAWKSLNIRSYPMYIHGYGVYKVFLAWKSLNIRSCTVYMHGSGQPYIYGVYSWFWPTLTVSVYGPKPPYR